MTFNELTPEWREAFLRKWAHLERHPRAMPRPAQVVPFPNKLSEQELMRRQQVIDQTWQRNLEAQRDLEQVRGGGFHKGFNDQDWRR
jgi:hypothetical protein